MQVASCTFRRVLRKEANAKSKSGASLNFAWKLFCSVYHDPFDRQFTKCTLKPIWLQNFWVLHIWGAVWGVARVRKPRRASLQCVGLSTGPSSHFANLGPAGELALASFSKTCFLSLALSSGSSSPLSSRSSDTILSPVCGFKWRDEKTVY